MEKKNDIRVIGIILSEATFKRIPNVTFEEKLIENKLNNNIGINIRQDGITTIFKVDLKRINKENKKEEVSFSVTYVGMFSRPTEMTDDECKIFAKKDAPAIIYPYIRETVSAMSLKAGIGPISLPIINFKK